MIKFTRHAKGRMRLYDINIEDVKLVIDQGERELLSPLIPLKEGENRMKVTYDKEADAAYIELSGLKPDGVIEVAEGINIDVTSDGKIVGVELLDASEKVSLDAIKHHQEIQL